VIPTKRKLMSLDLKYFNAIFTPKIIEIDTKRRPKIPLTISKASSGIIKTPHFYYYLVLPNKKLLNK
jgi:hypothetical protein